MLAARAEDAKEVSLAESVSNTLQDKQQTTQAEDSLKPHRHEHVTQGDSQYWTVRSALLSNAQYPESEIIPFICLPL